MALADELTKLGKEIETSKRNAQQLEGRKAELLSRLKSEYGVSTIEEAENLLDQLASDVEKLNNKITKDFDELKGLFAW